MASDTGIILPPCIKSTHVGIEAIHALNKGDGEMDKFSSEIDESS